MSMTFSKAFKDFLATGKKQAEAIAEDAAPKGNDGKSVDLQRHDAQFHGGHYDGKGSCKYREAMAKGDNADKIAKAERDEEKANGGEKSATQQDYDDIENIRKKIEAAARLLNGRAGNLQALQASRRWPLLDSISGDPQITADLAKFVKSSDPAISGQAKDLEQVLFDIAAQKKLGWKQGVGMVPAALTPPAGGNSAPASAGGAPSGKFSDDDAKAILGRLAKSINHHIDKGDFTPNAGAIAKYQAAKADIAALKDPQLDKFCQEIDASLAAGNQKKVSKVPAPSQAWLQAHAPKMPAGGLGGLLGALMGAMGGGHGGHGGGAAKGPVKKGPWSGKTLTPFMAPSAFDSQLTAINANHPANSNPNWYKDEADKLTPQQAISQMESNGDIVKGGYRDTFDQNDPDENELWAGWRPSKKLSDDTAKMAAVVFADLKKRFPNMPWKANLELRCGTKPMTGGQSTHTQDWRRHTVLWNCEYGNIWGGVGLGKSNYGHNDNRFFGDVLRHELGHALMSDMLPNGKRKMSLFHKVLNDNWGDDAKELWAWGSKYLSSYSVTNKGNGPSAAEFLAESVSLFSSPDYAPGYLPEPIETFIATEIFGMQKPTTP